jgi:hypothetical protein
VGTDWTSWRAIRLHVTLAMVVPTFLALGWWQLDRALSGNLLSWAYTFEWPIFAAYAVFMWWKLLNEPRPGSDEEPGDGGVKPARKSGRRAEQKVTRRAELTAKEQADARAYNDYLEALSASGKKKHW